jgi:hypothetical protein
MTGKEIYKFINSDHISEIKKRVINSLIKD